MIKESLFYGKILLFGEYGIIEDSMGLSIPYDFYEGKFLFDESTDPEVSKESNQHLEAYLEHLEQKKQNNDLHVSLNLEDFRKDVEAGMFFDSSIPQGFGVGSSGALVAAIYDKYGIDKVQPSSGIQNGDILKLKQHLGEMESYFHGKSSGLDPLICYLKLPVLIKSKEELNPVGIPEGNAGNGAIFLLNTGAPGKTQPMVNIFLEKCKEEGFRTMLKKQFKKYNDACIDSFLNREFKPLLRNVKALSQVILDNFKPMIPDVFHKLWKEGLDSNTYYLKLCGSGGGGFILGFTEDIDETKEKLKDYQVDVIYNF